MNSLHLHPLRLESPFEYSFQKLLKENLQQFRPEERSETWAMLSHLKKRARKRRWRRWAIGMTLAFSAMLLLAMITNQP